MPQPIICLDEEVRHFAERFRPLYSKPQYQYFVTVLLGLMECEGRRTLSGLLREVGQAPSLSGLSRFLAEAPWCAEALVASWQKHFRTEMQPLVKAERDRPRKEKTVGRKCATSLSHRLVRLDEEVIREHPQRKIFFNLFAENWHRRQVICQQ